MSNGNFYPWAVLLGHMQSQGFDYQQYHNIPYVESYMMALQVERVENQKLRQKISYLQFLLQREQQSSLKTIIQELPVENPKLLSENAELKLQISQMEAELANLNCEIKDRNEKVIAEMDNEITMLKRQIFKLDVEIGSLKSESNAEKGLISELKLQISEMESELGDLNCKIKDRDEKMNDLNALNEVLGVGIEKRDETIVQYKKKMLKNITSSSSFDGDSLLEIFSPVPVSGNESTKSSSSIRSSLPPVEAPKREFGSKKLLAFTTLGAENTMGPRICTPCGKDGLPMNIPSNPDFRQHLTDIHKVAIDSALCKKCGWRSRNDRELDFHLFEKHQVESLFYSFSKSAILKPFEKC